MAVTMHRGLTRRWSERLAALIPSSAGNSTLNSQPRAVPPAVAHLVLVRCMSVHQRIILRFAVAGFATFGLAAVLYLYLFRVSPTSPDLQTGKTYAMQEHGYTFFITAAERFGFFALLAVFALLLLIATGLSIYWKKFLPRTTRPYNLPRNI